MTLVATALLVGALGALAVTALLAVLIPQRSDLVAVLRQPRTPLVSAALASSTGRESVPMSGWAGIRHWVESRLDRVSWLRTPDRDLQVLEITRGSFLAVRVGAALAGTLIGPVYSAFFAVLGVSLPFSISALAGLILGAVLWAVAGAYISDRAQSRRREMRYALVGFLTLVALHRAAGEAMGQALERSAASSDTWAYRLILRRMQSAARGGSNEWAGLAALATELGVEELADLADISHVAAGVGAGVYSTLMARAQSLRRELQSSEEEAATAASTRLAIPKALLTMSMAAFLLYPALMRLMGN